MKDCIEDYKLFQKNDNKFYSNSLLRRMQEKDKKSSIAREKAQKRWNSNAVVMQQQCSSNANKEKENKEKESKVKENNNTSDSCVDGLQEVIDFYNNNIGLATPYTLEVLEDYTKELSKDLVIYAMQISVEANKRNGRYIKAILNNWKKAGIKTLVEAKQENRRTTNTSADSNHEQREYTEEELNKLYANEESG